MPNPDKNSNPNAHKQDLNSSLAAVGCISQWNTFRNCAVQDHDINHHRHHDQFNNTVPGLVPWESFAFFKKNPRPALQAKDKCKG